MKLHPHTFTAIAPETTECGEEHTAMMWEWCTLCGTLKLGTLIFVPGPKQEADLCVCEHETVSGGTCQDCGTGV